MDTRTTMTALCLFLMLVIGVVNRIEAAPGGIVFSTKSGSASNTSGMFVHSRPHYIEFLCTTQCDLSGNVISQYDDIILVNPILTRGAGLYPFSWTRVGAASS